MEEERLVCLGPGVQSQWQGAGRQGWHMHAKCAERPAHVWLPLAGVVRWLRGKEGQLGLEGYVPEGEKGRLWKVAEGLLRAV